MNWRPERFAVPMATKKWTVPGATWQACQRLLQDKFRLRPDLFTSALGQRVAGRIGVIATSRSGLSHENRPYLHQKPQLRCRWTLQPRDASLIAPGPKFTKLMIEKQITVPGMAIALPRATGEKRQ